MKKLDFGEARDSYVDTKDFESYSLNELVPGDKIIGEIYITDFRISKESGEEYFTVLITNYKKELKWAITFYPTLYYNEDGNDPKIYGKKGGRLYIFLDTFMSIVMKEDVNKKPYRSYYFEQFRETVNRVVTKVEVEAIKSKHENAKSPNVRFLRVTLSEE